MALLVAEAAGDLAAGCAGGCTDRVLKDRDFCLLFAWSGLGEGDLADGSSSRFPCEWLNW